MPSRLDMTVRVLPNPYHSLDHEGRPIGICPKERPMSMAGGHQGYVGAVILATIPKKLEDGHQGTASQDTVFHFSREPVQLNDPRGYYRQAVKHGALIAADVKTATMAGVKYQPYALALEAAREEAVAKWRDAFGDDELPDVDPFTKPTPGVLPGDAPVESVKEMAPRFTAKDGE